MAMVNAQLEFIYVNVGTNGRVSDGGVFENTSFRQKLYNNQLSLPEVGKYNLNCVFVGDDAFPLQMSSSSV